MFHKILNDPVHGHVQLDQWQLRVIDTPQFQRLRDLKQLGTSYHVFPGGSHNRFEHSIGVSYLANNLVSRLAESQPELGIDERDIRCVTLAGLCHDLGHGPFSHVFDHEFIPRARQGLNWTHEQASEMMLDYMVEDNDELQDNLSRQDVQFIKDLIHGEPRTESSRQQKQFLFDIVANKRNGLDVDKFDYIQRDCYNIGTKSSYDCSRLMLFSRVIDNQICYSHKEIFNIYELFHTRYSLFKRVYSHKVSKARELMIVDAMLAADSHLNISGAIDSPEDYMLLTDNIIAEIQKSRSKELEKARQIIKRMQKRYLYKFVEEYTLPLELRPYITRETFTADNIVAHQDSSLSLSSSSSSSSSRLTTDDIIVDWLVINYGMRDQNPLDHIKFYGKWDTKRAFRISHDRVSYLVPESYEELTIRIFARDPVKVPDIQAAFRRCMKSLTRSYVGQITVSAGGSLLNSRHVSPKTGHQWSQIGSGVALTAAECNYSSSTVGGDENVQQTIANRLQQLGLLSSSSPDRSYQATNRNSPGDSAAVGGRILREFEEDPLSAVPGRGRWDGIVRERGYSPRPKFSRTTAILNDNNNNNNNNTSKHDSNGNICQPIKVFDDIEDLLQDEKDYD